MKPFFIPCSRPSRFSILVCALAAAMALSTRAFADTYRIDEDHTSISFSVKHMMLFDVKGNFTDFSGTFDFDEKTGVITGAKADITAESVDTRTDERDKVLRSKDFLDVEKFPHIVFVLKKAESLGENRIHAVGGITIHGITREIALDGEFLGSVTDLAGNKRAGFTAAGKLKRGDFGLTWNKPLETGGFLVGEEVKISLEIEGIKNK